MNEIKAACFVALCVLWRSMGFACPYFVEFFSDPKDVPDVEGEFVEIRLDEPMADSLQIQMDEKASLNLGIPRGKRLVLVHDSAFCPRAGDVSCGMLGALSLPNSRESLWRLRSGNCLDSIVLPVPKPGLSLQRVQMSDQWEFAYPTEGSANSSFEEDVKDCGFERVEKFFFAEDSSWQYTVFLSGCDSTDFILETVNPEDDCRSRDSVKALGVYRWVSDSENLWIRGILPEDEAPANDTLDTLILGRRLGFPLTISEIHHCPQEPEPEWVEIYNSSSVRLPLSKFQFCNRGDVWNSDVKTSPVADSLDPHESFILSKDTTALREVLGFGDVRLVQESFGYLNNTSGCLSVCMGNFVVDSVCWDRKTVNCPAGFNPMTRKAEFTPGFVRAFKDENRSTPFSFRLSSRIVRIGGSPLRIFVEGENAVTVRLLDSTGRERWRKNLPPMYDDWLTVPIRDLSIGVSYVSLTAGKFENSVGILVRP